MNSSEKMFPTKCSLFVFILYITLFVLQGLFVTASQKPNNSYTYNTVLAVFLTEVTKLAISVIMYCCSHSVCSLFTQIRVHIKLMLLYFISASLYCLYNNLSYINLATYDPTTYSLLLQLRVVITGVIYEILFRRSLSSVQWLSLVLLLLGCALKDLNFDWILSSIDGNTNIHDILPQAQYYANFKNATFHTKERGVHLNFSLLLIILQVFSSCFAGVFNEFLLKSKDEQAHLFIQNIFICLDSVICTIIILLWQSGKDIFSWQSFHSVTNFQVSIVILNNAAIGITTCFFLKYLNSILKTIASAVESIFIALFSCILLGFPIGLNTILSIAVVSLAVIIYSRNPVKNSININNNNNEISRKLLQEQPC